MFKTAFTGNIKAAAVLAGALAVATSSAAAFAGTSTSVTWNFGTASSSASKHLTGDLGIKATFTGAETPANSLGSPLSGDLGITAYGEKVTTTQNLDNNGNPTGSPTYGKAHATELYGKNGGGTENGLGLDGFTDSEISDTTPNVPLQKSHCGRTRVETYQTGMVQIDLTNILAFLTNASPADATLTIGSLQSPDEAIISVSTSRGTIGKQIGSVASGNGSNQSTTISLSELTGESYLNISAAAAGQAGSDCQPGTPGQTVLLSTITLNVPNPSAIPAGPSVPTPASFGLLAVGGLGLASIVLRRRKSHV